MIKAITELVYTAFRVVDIVGLHCFHSSKGAVRETCFSRQRTGQPVSNGMIAAGHECTRRHATSQEVARGEGILEE